LPLSILNQPQKTSRTGCVGWIGNDFLPEQRIAYVSHVNQEFVDDIVRQPITEAVNKAAYRAHRMKFASETYLRFG